MSVPMFRPRTSSRTPPERNGSVGWPTSTAGTDADRTDARQAQRHEARRDGRRLAATTADRRGRHARLRGAFRSAGRRRMDGHAAAASPRATSACRACCTNWPSEALGRIPLDHLALHHGARIGEVPIVFVERRHGRSKVSLKVLAESLAMPCGSVSARTCDERPDDLRRQAGHPGRQAGRPTESSPPEPIASARLTTTHEP